MRNRIAWLASLLAGLPAGHAADASGRFQPADPNYLVLEVPAGEDAQLERFARAAREPGAALRVAERYLELARATREQRYYGRAEAMLKPWLARPDAAPELLRVQADILQNRHDFAAARRLLDRALELDPRDAQARLMRATVLMVQGNSADARADCAALIAIGAPSPGTVCLAQTLAASGQLARASSMIELLMARAALPDPEIQAWAQSSLADFASRRAGVAAAEPHLRAALSAAPRSEYIRCALSDILIARGAADEALGLLDLPRPSVGILVRRLLAQTVLGAVDSSRDTRVRLEELLRLETRRGERVHLREEALLALGLGKPAGEALEVARANFAVQREPIDVRLLARAAVNAGDREALQELREWRRKTGFTDRLVDALLKRAG